MVHVNVQEVRRQHLALQREVQRWEADPVAHLPRLRAAIRGTHEQLQAWDDAGVYPGSEVRLLRDEALVAEARITQAAQEHTSGR